MAIDTTKISTDVANISAAVDRVAAAFTAAQTQTATDEAAAQQTINAAAGVLSTARDKLNALAPPQPG